MRRVKTIKRVLRVTQITGVNMQDPKGETEFSFCVSGWNYTLGGCYEEAAERLNHQNFRLGAVTEMEGIFEMDLTTFVNNATITDLYEIEEDEEGTEE